MGPKRGGGEPFRQPGLSSPPSVELRCSRFPGFARAADGGAASRPRRGAARPGRWRLSRWGSRDCWPRPPFKHRAHRTKLSLALGKTSIAESGGGNSTTVKATLPSAASTAVTVTLGSSPPGKVNFGTATLTIPANGTESGTVTVTAVDNKVDAADALVTISGTTTSSGVTPPDSVSLTVTDDDTKGFTVWFPHMAVPEGATARYQVRLDSEPTASVVVTPLSSDAGVVTVSTAATDNTLTFTPSNWFRRQHVMVTGVRDADSADESITVTHAVSGAGSGYESVSVDDVRVRVRDYEVSSTAPTGTSFTPTGWLKAGDTLTMYFKAPLPSGPPNYISINFEVADRYDSEDKFCTGNPIYISGYSSAAYIDRVNVSRSWTIPKNGDRAHDKYVCTDLGGLSKDRLKIDTRAPYVPRLQAVAVQRFNVHGYFQGREHAQRAHRSRQTGFGFEESGHGGHRRIAGCGGLRTPTRKSPRSPPNRRQRFRREERLPPAR